MTGVGRSDGAVRRERLKLCIAAGLVVVIFGSCFWAYLQQYEFTDGYYSNIRDIHGIDDKFPEVVSGPEIFARWKTDGYMERIVIWGRTDEARLKKFAEQYGWDVIEDSGMTGNWNLDLEVIPANVRSETVFDDSDLWLIGRVPLRTTQAGINIFFSRKTGFAFVEITR